MSITVFFRPFAFMTLATMALAAAILSFAVPSYAQSARVKDLASVEGIRQNQLVGYGLVVGLNGTGDSLNNSPFTRQSLTAMLERLGVNTRGANLRTANVAAVMVTANLPPFAQSGTRIDVTVSALGDAKNLQGGTLLVTPLLGATGDVYAVAQGSVAIAGFQAEGAAASITRGVPTSGRIANGAIIEREVEFALKDAKTLRLSLRNPDMTTAQRMSSIINEFMGGVIAEATDPSTVVLSMPKDFKGSMSKMISEIELLQIIPDQIARVVIDERSGVIVMGSNVRVSTVAIAQGNLTIAVNEQPQVSQPNPLANGETVVVPQTTVQVDEQGNRKLAILKEGIALSELVDGLNALGIGPRDMISILQAIKAAGALQAEIEVM